MEVVEKDAAAALWNLAAKNKKRLRTAAVELGALFEKCSPPSLLSVWLARPSFRKMGEAWKLLAWAQWTVASNSKWWNYLISFNYLHDSLILG